MENVRKQRDIKLVTTDKEEINKFQSLIITRQKIFRKRISNWNEKGKSKNKQASISWHVNIGY